MSSMELSTIGSYTDFLNALLSFESGLDPEKLSDYTGGGTTTYFQVSKDTNGNPIPGTALRNPDGSFLPPVVMTYPEYFATLGVDFEAATVDETALAKARYASINFLGFMGFQVGEATLISGGYYTPPTHDDGEHGVLPAYYQWTGEENRFANGNIYSYFVNEGSSTGIYTTSTNRWEGEFSGKDGLTSLEDLKNPRVQELVIRTLMEFNLAKMEEQFKVKTGQTDVSSQRVFQQILSITVPQPGGEGSVVPTISGLLASCHLRGPWGVAGVLITGQDSGDETGTSVFDYCTKFNDYATNFATPGQFQQPAPEVKVLSEEYPERVYTGWQSDTITIPLSTEENPKTILIHPGAFSNITIDVEDPQPRTDRYILRDYPAETGLGHNSDGTVTGITQNPDGVSFAFQTVTGPSVKPDNFVVSRTYPLTWEPRPVAEFLPTLHADRDVFAMAPGVGGMTYDNLALGWTHDGKSALFVGADPLTGGTGWYPAYSLPPGLGGLTAENFVGFEGVFTGLRMLVTHTISTTVRSTDLARIADTAKIVTDVPVNFKNLVIGQYASVSGAYPGKVFIGYGDDPATGDWSPRLAFSDLTDPSKITASLFDGVNGNFSDIQTTTHRFLTIGNLGGNGSVEVGPGVIFTDEPGASLGFQELFIRPNPAPTSFGWIRDERNQYSIPNIAAVTDFHESNFMNVAGELSQMQTLDPPPPIVDMLEESIGIHKYNSGESKLIRPIRQDGSIAAFSELFHAQISAYSQSGAGLLLLGFRGEQGGSGPRVMVFDSPSPNPSREWFIEGIDGEISDMDGSFDGNFFGLPYGLVSKVTSLTTEDWGRLRFFSSNIYGFSDLYIQEINKGKWHLGTRYEQTEHNFVSVPNYLFEVEDLRALLGAHNFSSFRGDFSEMKYYPL